MESSQRRSYIYIQLFRANLEGFSKFDKRRALVKVIWHLDLKNFQLQLLSVDQTKFI